MANRPGMLCTLRSGKAIGAQSNFAATFNWLVACMKNLRGGRGVKVKWPADDTPEIEADGEDAAGGGGGGDGDGASVSAVKDVDGADTTEGKRLTVSYTDGTADKLIDVPCKPKFTGTDNSYTSNAVAFTFASSAYSNVQVTCSGTTITIGAFYV